MKEVYKDIIGYEGLYQISNFGTVLSLKKDRLLKPQKSRKGYRLIVLSNKGAIGRGIHRLVAEAFIPNPLNLPQVNHKDGDKTNNYSNNLEWMTCSNNIRHAHNNNLYNFKGEKNSLHKLTEIEVLEIRDFYKNDPPGRLKKGRLKPMAEKYKVTPTLISYIRNRRFWTHI